MKFDLENPYDVDAAKVLLDKLIEEKKFIEIKKISPRSTDKQRRYLHLILGRFAVQYGETLEYVKVEFYKKQCNPELYIIDRINPKTGEIRKALRSSEDLDVSEKALSITRFRNWSSNEGIYLPEPGEEQFLRHIEIEMEKHKEYI